MRMETTAVDAGTLDAGKLAPATMDAATLDAAALVRLLFACLVCTIGSLNGPASGDQPAPFPKLIPAYAQAGPLREDATLRSVAFNSDGRGVACGDRGAILRTVDGGENWEACESDLDCPLLGIQWVASNRVVIVGGALDRITGISRGVVLISDDGGATWTRSGDEELPKLRSISWKDDLLVAGGDWSDSLLTNRFESRDRGRTWHAADPQDSLTWLPTEASEFIRWAEAIRTPLTVRHACRASNDVLCAVGDHGTILLSRDRGRNWTATRGEGRTTAVLIVAQNPHTVPWTLLGNESIESRNRVAVLLHEPFFEAPAVESETSPGNDAKLKRLDLANQAAVALGAAGADAIGSTSIDLTLVARQWIAIHRPAVLVVDRLLDEDVSNAFFDAAAAAGVRRIVRYDLHDGGGGRRGDTALHRDALLTRSGVLASDLHTDAMLWIDPLRLDTGSIHLRTLYDTTSGAHRGESVASGLALPEGYQLDAAGPVASRRKLQIAQARMNQSERIEALISRSRSIEQFSAAVDRVLDLTSNEDQFRLGWSIIAATHRPGDSLHEVNLHETALERFASRFPTTSAGRWARLRLEVIRHSVEWTRLRSLLSETAAPLERSTTVESVAVSPFQVAGGGVRQASAVAPLVVPKPEVIDMNQGTDQPEEQVDLAWEFHPAVLFAREAAKQRSDVGLLQAMEKESANLKRLAESTHPWSALLRSVGPQTIIAHRASSPPRLDGLLREECWLSNRDVSRSTTHSVPNVQVAYDDDYVYLAVELPAAQIRRDTEPTRDAAGNRDQDLSRVDRLQFWIDVDRDLASAMQLQVSDAGRVRDAVDGCTAWQPTWYPAIRRDERLVTYEIAILRRDLVDLPITPSESWMIMAKPLRAGQSPPSLVSPNPGDWYRVIFAR